MPLPKSFTTVTSFSKTVALVIFTLLPICAFFLGMRYQGILDGTATYPTIPSLPTEPKACTAEAMICPDGSAVGRTGPNCEFSPCPTGTTPSISASPSEGFTGVENFTCPQEEWINCMPGFGPRDQRCKVDFLKWAQQNCEGFKGAAY